MIWRSTLLYSLLMSLCFAGELSFTGSAMDIETGDLLYVEHHTLTIDDNGDPVSETVEYRDAKNHVLGFKTMRYQQPTAPDYTVQFDGIENTESVQITDASILIERSTAKNLAIPSGLFAIDGGFHYLILENFDKLTNGENIEFEFLSASRGRFISMLIEPVKSQNGYLTLKLSLQNFILAKLVKPIELTYEIKTLRLLNYRGLTNIVNSQKKLLSATIHYDYPTKFALLKR